MYPVCLWLGSEEEDQLRRLGVDRIYVDLLLISDSRACALVHLSSAEEVMMLFQCMACENEEARQPPLSLLLDYGVLSESLFSQVLYTRRRLDEWTHKTPRVAIGSQSRFWLG